MSLEKGTLAAEKNKHYALAPSSGKWEVHIGPICINRLVIKHCLWLSDQASGQLLVISLRVETDIGLSRKRIGPG